MRLTICDRRWGAQPYEQAETLEVSAERLPPLQYHLCTAELQPTRRRPHCQTWATKTGHLRAHRCHPPCDCVSPLPTGQRRPRCGPLGVRTRFYVYCSTYSFRENGGLWCSLAEAGPGRLARYQDICHGYMLVTAGLEQCPNHRAQALCLLTGRTGMPHWATWALGVLAPSVDRRPGGPSGKRATGAAAGAVACGPAFPSTDSSWESNPAVMGRRDFVL